MWPVAGHFGLCVPDHGGRWVSLGCRFFFSQWAYGCKSAGDPCNLHCGDRVAPVRRLCACDVDELHEGVAPTLLTLCLLEQGSLCSFCRRRVGKVLRRSQPWRRRIPHLRSGGRSEPGGRTPRTRRAWQSSTVTGGVDRRGRFAAPVE